jgi:hypothetical protein
MTFAPFHWHYYRTASDTFPLNDSPILVTEDTVMVALSPRLMLEIDRTKQQRFDAISYSNYICPQKLDVFRVSTIRNTYREIIFSSAARLEDWKASPEFQARHELMQGSPSYVEMLEKDGSKELWNINAFANR